nr:MAG TPA: hypothetical protein [Caudoviricetes sp.]
MQIMSNFVNKDGNIILNLNYSSEESFTGMYWIDGKKIYRKYINFNISSSSYDYTHNLNVAEYVKFDLKCTFSDGTIVSLPYVFFESENKWTNCLLITSLKANYIRFYNAWATGRIYGIIEYTKN